MLTLLIVISLAFGGGRSTPVQSGSADARTAELEQLFDPGFQHAGLTDDYSERAFPPPPAPPDTEYPYQPDLEDEYY